MANARNTDPLIKRTRRLTRKARARLFWERYAPVLALAAIAVSVFLIGSFAGIWERIGDPWRGFALAATLYVLIKTFISARKVKRPTTSDARRRVERDSGARHRPLDTLDDRPALSQDLWPAHYAAARDAAALLDPPLPRPVLAPIDTYYLRFALPAVLILALMVGVGDNLERVKRSLTPTWQSAISSHDVTFEAWVDPPDYTGRPPIYFKDKTNIDVPAGSELVARISGTKNATRLKLTGKHRSRYLPLTRLGPKSFEARAIINDSRTARWRVGNLEKSWTLTALPDRAPTVDFKINPRADKRDRLAFTYSFKDDYGITDLSLDMQLLTDEPQRNPVIESMPVPLPGYSVREADFETAALNLTKHKWAGQKVSAQLTVRDGLGQIAKTETVYFTVPDKIFIEPLAKAVTEHRRLVLEGQVPYAPLPEMTNADWAHQPWFDTYETDKRLGRAHPSVQRAAELIEAVTDYPQGLYEDPAVFMGLKHVLSRLRYAHSEDGLSGIPDDLWRIAIRAEFGILGTALEEMREASAALRDGIARRAAQREIDTLFERYNEAVDRYMEELRRKAMEEGNIAEGGQGGGGNQSNIDEIQALLDAIEEANRIGDTEGARRGLEKLAELLENMQIQLTMSPGGGGDGEPFEGELSEEMKKSLEDMADLLGEQRELKDETEQAQRQDQDGENSDSSDAQNPSGGAGSGQQDDQALSPGELAERQRALENALGGLAENLPSPDAQSQGGSLGNEEDETGSGGAEDGENGQTPGEALADAERAMGDSAQALGRGDLDGAASAQADAIEALRRAGRGLAEQARRNQSGSQEAQGGDNTDPLGRENSGQNDDESEADIDSRDNATRSRELLDELRRRAAEQEREEQERQYLERLLKRF